MMMKLDKSLTKIEIEEQVVEEWELTAPVPQREMRCWSADLDGETLEGEIVRMSRNGKSPDDALKNLFEAMSDAGITL